MPFGLKVQGLRSRFFLSMVYELLRAASELVWGEALPRWEPGLPGDTYHLQRLVGLRIAAGLRIPLWAARRAGLARQQFSFNSWNLAVVVMVARIPLLWLGGYPPVS